MRILSGIILILTFFLPVDASTKAAAADVYHAQMIVTVDNHSTTTNLWAKSGLMRVSMMGGRTFSTAITDYTQKKSWAINPSHMVYQEFSSSQIRSYTPEFFNPEVKIEKLLLGEEKVRGLAARKYQATVIRPGRSPLHGTLWEAIELPGYPLQWEEPAHRVHAIWKNAGLVSRPDSFFLVPANVREQKPKPPSPRQQTSGCNKPGRQLTQKPTAETP